jgi:hypothetical protein
LRVADETAGRQAKCPACGVVQQIPAASPAPEMRSAPPQTGSPFSGAPDAVFGGLPPVGPNDNPYASPQSPLPPSAGPFYDSGGPRSGPPWERNGASIGAYFETLMLTFSAPSLMFREMRREGGLGAPLGYGLAGGVAWGMIGLAFQLGVQSLMMGMAGGLGPGAPPVAGPAMMLGIGVVGGLVFLPISLIIGMFVSAGVFHLMLMMLGAARQPFETTFRVVAYCTGGASVFSAVPLCGAYIQMIVHLVFVGIGLCHSHEISGGKAAMAVILPAVICCGAAIALYAVVIGAIVAGAR